MTEKKKGKAENQKTCYPEVMTIEQLSGYLQLHKQVIYRHIRSGNIPVSRIGATIRFKKSVIDEWLEDSALRSLQKSRGAKREASYLSFNPEED